MRRRFYDELLHLLLCLQSFILINILRFSCKYRFYCSQYFGFGEQIRWKYHLIFYASLLAGHNKASQCEVSMRIHENKIIKKAFPYQLIRFRTNCCIIFLLTLRKFILKQEQQTLQRREHMVDLQLEVNCLEYSEFNMFEFFEI